MITVNEPKLFEDSREKRRWRNLLRARCLLGWLIAILVGNLLAVVIASAANADDEILAKRHYVKRLERGWEMKAIDRFWFGQYQLLIKDGELTIQNSREICWTAGSAEWCPKDATDVKLVFQEDGNLALWAYQSNGKWKPYWWTDTDFNKRKPDQAVGLAFYEDEPYLQILDQKGGVLWHAMIKGHIRLNPSSFGGASGASQTGSRSSSNAPANNHSGRAVLLSPAGAPSLVLETNKVGSRDETIVYPASAKNELNQKWILESKRPGIFAIRPAFDRSLALTIKNGKFLDGTRVIVAVDHGYSTQTWSIVRSGNYLVLRPMCAPNLVLDNAGGPHTPIDILHYVPGNLNTMWIVHEVSL